jgi:hypothetical protein
MMNIIGNSGRDSKLSFVKIIDLTTDCKLFGIAKRPTAASLL